jgi:2,4-dienoyl-CoA reductase-like NADH-dependent reductase (Old Yellow Enzyme family)
LKTLFSTITIGTVTLRNRTVVAPMTRTSATEDGRVTDPMVVYYEEFARGGWGLVETEAAYIDNEYSQCRHCQPGIATTEHRDAWYRVVDAVHARGAAIFIQLQHAGALAEARKCRTETVGPSAIPPRSKKTLPVPRELTEAEIARIQEHFAGAAVRAVEAGFDGIELHGHNGYLIDQFLTDDTNVRTDRYGGPAANRIRFASETIEAVRRAVPAGFPVGIRLNQSKTDDPAYVWPGGEEDAATIVGSLLAAGANFFHISGLHLSPAARGNQMLLDMARRLTNVAVIANGGLDEPGNAEALVSSGRADLVALARGALANPDWPLRVAAKLPLAAYNPAMIKPTPTLENADAWRRQQAGPQRCQPCGS